MSEVEDRLERYLSITKRALDEVKIAREKEQAEDFLRMAKDYYNDALHFRQKNELATALAAVSYAHAWLDAGARLGFFEIRSKGTLFASD